MHKKNIVFAGKQPAAGGKVLIMIHGRGGSAEDILSLAGHLNIQGFSLVAPKATNNAWYPFSFMAPEGNNEPWLSSAISLLLETITDLETKGIHPADIYFLGFSQGACLTLEFVARNAKQYGGVIAFTGGLIGETINEAKYGGDFKGMPVFIGSSDPDAHVPVERVYESEKLLKQLNANVNVKIYKGMGHTINTDEIEEAVKILGK